MGTDYIITLLTSLFQGLFNVSIPQDQVVGWELTT